MTIFGSQFKTTNAIQEPCPGTGSIQLRYVSSYINELSQDSPSQADKPFTGRPCLLVIMSQSSL